MGLETMAGRECPWSGNTVIAALKFIGKPCRVCGGTLRYQNNSKCEACQKKNAKKSADKHRAEYTERYRGRYTDRTRVMLLVDLTYEEYYAQCEMQNWCCAICKKIPKKKLYVDHCHKSIKFRGLLCSSCNAAIGLMNDSPERLLSAIKYLKGENK